MRAPAFWWRPEPGLAATLLGPAASLYGAVAAGRMRRAGASAPVPVVCVGNVTVGGSGKTPTALALARLLREDGRRPAFLTRGYGGCLPGPVAVEPDRHGSADIGDEPLLLAREAPTIVSRDRPAGAALAASLGADAIVMDDGLQNPSLVKSLALAVFDGAVGIGNGRVLPAGPLRAPMTAQWPRIDAVVIVGPGRADDAVATEAGRRGRPVFRAALEPDGPAALALAGHPVLAFAGIGRPAKFFATCREAGLTVAVERPFPDHHAYRIIEVTRLLDEADAAGLVPVTTVKDAVRLAALRPAEPRVDRIRTLPVRLSFGADAERLRALLRSVLG